MIRPHNDSAGWWETLPLPLNIRPARRPPGSMRKPDGARARRLSVG